MTNKTWNKIGIVAAVIIAVPITWNMTRGSVAMAEVPDRMDRFEHKFDTNSEAVNSRLERIEITLEIDSITNRGHVAIK